MSAFIDWWRTWIWGEPWRVCSSQGWGEDMRSGVKAHILADILSMYLETPITVLYRGKTGTIKRGELWSYGSSPRY